MLYSTDGTPLKEVLQAAALRRATSQLGKQKPTPYLRDPRAPDGRAQRTLRNKLGDVYRVFRARWVDRPGRGYVERQAIKEQAAEARSSVDYAEAVKYHGSQRKAAAALGISLGKLQRELRKQA